MAVKRVAALFVIGFLLVYALPSRGGQPAPPVTTVPGVIQPPVTTVPSPASPQNPMDQVEWALAASFLLRYVTKKRWFQFLSDETEPQIKTLVGFVTAFGTAAGIHFVVNGSPFDGHGATVTVSGISFDLIKDVGFQWVSQQAWYEGLVKQVQPVFTAVEPMIVDHNKPIQPFVNLKGSL